MSLVLNSGCKVNLLLNILGRRPDGFHELETVFQPMSLHDILHFHKQHSGFHLTCSNPDLAVDSTNLVHRAAGAFMEATGISDGVRIHLEKRLPIAAGLGAGSANAAITLTGLNQLFDHPLLDDQMCQIAATLGSDVPFFLHSAPAIGTGRGENIELLKPFECLRGKAILLIRPGFGISTAWAYSALKDFPEALNGRTGRAQELVELLERGALDDLQAQMYNSLEAPAFHKYPVLALLKEFLLENGAIAALMSGSGSTTFAIISSPNAAESIRETMLARFGSSNWTAIAEL